MKRFILMVVLCGCTNVDETAKYRFDNGLWFNGTSFESKTVYVKDGLLYISSKELPTDQTVDLQGAYVVPPFCEGHNHNFGGNSEPVDETVQSYLRDGVFYAMMPGSFKLYRDMSADSLNTPTSIDVAFANNGLTGTGGHPRGLRESLMDRFGLYPEYTKETLPDVGYFEADTLSQVQEKWKLIEAEDPDFIKVMLFFSEEYQERKDDPEFYGKRGLAPELLPEVVRLAHGKGLRVAVHVESDADMKTALRAGADMIMHLPSYDSTETISDESISLAIKNNAAIITTFTVANRYRIRTPEKFAAILEAQRANLARLQEAGVKLVVGSDSVRDTSRGEANHLASLGVLSNLTLLKMWTENCAKTAFPKRKIGRVEDGYEASFLALEGDPLSDFENTKRISLRVKDARLLSIPSFKE